MIRLGLDLHGVIDAAPEFFSNLAGSMTDRGHEVYIVTGREDTPELEKELIDAGMIILSYENPDEPKIANRLYSSILSITSFRKEQGVSISYLEGRKSQPMMDPKVWNPTKAVLCATAGIDIMIDDSALYEPFFRDIKTQYIIFTPVVQEWLNLIYYQSGCVV